MPHHPPLPKAPLPTREIFDPFNPSSTGHQTAPHRLSGSLSWRDSRTYKLAHQFRDTSGRGGSRRLSDLVGAGSENWQKDGRKGNKDREPSAPGLREKGWQDIRGLMSGSRKRSSEEIEAKDVIKKKRPRLNEIDHEQSSDGTLAVPKAAVNGRDSKNVDNSCSPMTSLPPQIFRGLTVYFNGSTAPEMSDHKLKQLFMQHGGNSSLALGRRTVTHVILGKTCGGGLASGKINKEVTTIGGKGIKYVTVHWILDSVARGIRQPEGQYMPHEIARRIGGSRQSSVKSMFAAKPAVEDGG